jgi:transcriptional regulator with XRE-family HTH domain
MLVLMKTFRQLLEERIAGAYQGSAADFSRSTGFTPQTVSSWRKGRVTLPQASTRRVLAREFGISHIELLAAMGELDESEISVPEDPRSDAVRRLQPLIDSIQWNDGVYRIAERQLEAIRDLQRGMLQAPRMLTEMEDSEGIRATEFGEEN